MAYGTFAPDQEKEWGGGEGTAVVMGTFAGETVTLQGSADGVNWGKIGADGVFTDEGWANFRLPSGVKLRFNVAGGSGSGLLLFLTGKVL